MNLDEWNTALFEEVRARANPRQRLYLYVDRDILSRISELAPVDAVDDFASAFRVASGTEPFRRAAEHAIRWRMRGYPGDPAFVAHLAMTVLAVTEEPVGARHGIYARQNLLLGLPAIAAEPPGYGDDVPKLWSVWNSWLDGPGAMLGRSTAKTHPHWTLQGWARSQALVRFTDRLRIEDFLEDSDPGRELVPTLFDLITWLRYRGSAGADMLERFGDQPSQSILSDVLDDEVTRWHREGPRTRAAGVTRALLHYDDWTGTFRGAVTVDATRAGSRVDVGEDEPRFLDEHDDVVLVAAPGLAYHLLRFGVEHALTDEWRIHIGGEALYVMRDDPSVDGRLQCRSISGPSVVHVLVQTSGVDELAASLRNAGIQPEARPCEIDGWTWLESIRLAPDQLEVLRLLGLARSAPAPDRVELTGGLPVGRSTYLVGGEPDLRASTDSVVVDGVQQATRDGHLRLAGLGLGPGHHTVMTSAGAVSFRTFDFLREMADGGGLSRPVRDPGDGVLRFDDATRSSASTASLAGAVLTGIESPEPIVMRRPPRAECLIVGESGDVVEISPAPPAWMRAIGLSPLTVDVLNAIRSTVPDAVCFMVRFGPRNTKHAVAIPPGTTLSPGRRASRPRPDLVCELVTDNQWQWTGPADPRARSSLAKALRNTVPQRAGGTSTWPPAGCAVEIRPDVVPGRLPDNPYDDILTWLSERENGRATNTDFAQAWSWLCRRYRQADAARGWRLAVRTLGALGHVERDYARQQIAIAPAALAALPSAAGLHVLTGARPVRLVERMDDPDDDDGCVAAAVACWTLQSRTPVRRDGRPVGPCAVYAEWVSRDRETVTKGLARLGVTVVGQIAGTLLATQPSLGAALETGQRLSMSPSREPLLWSRTASGQWEWFKRDDDAVRGLYWYRLKGQDVYAWRTGPGADLVEVDPAVGMWMGRESWGYTQLLDYDPIGRRLFTPPSAPLPDLVARSLTLRTGLPPALVDNVLDDTHVDGTARLVYENVDQRTATHVSRLLGQQLRVMANSVRMER